VKLITKHSYIGAVFVSFRKEPTLDCVFGPKENEVRKEYTIFHKEQLRDLYNKTKPRRLLLTGRVTGIREGVRNT
jgi:hypothetical protein